MFSKLPYINGELVKTTSSYDVINPATNQVSGTIDLAAPTEANLALEGAQAAFPIWSTTPVQERVDWMHKLRDAVLENEDHLRECVHFEMGKPWSSTKDDFDMLVDSLNFYADEILKIKAEELQDRDGTHTHIISREPVGVVAAFLAWNFPLLNLAYKLGPAMAAGCPIIIKPSMQTPLSAYAVGELCQKIGLPAGAVNIISGRNSEIGDLISSSKIPAMLTLIGSTQTGLHVMKAGATSIKRYSMELGGNAPVLVFADADLDLAADTVCGLKYSNAGQICVAPNRVFVAAEIAKEFNQKIVDRANARKVGFGKDQDIEMGPVIDQNSWDRIDSLVQDAVSDGAKLLAGGGRPPGLKDGTFYAPTVLGNVKDEMRVAREEIFGPIVNLMEFTDEDAVLEAANNTDAGLTAYIFTEDQDRADFFASKLRFGEIQINGVKYAINLPHCGINQSGIGVDCSHLALDEYLVPKRVSRAIVK